MHKITFPAYLLSGLLLLPRLAGAQSTADSLRPTGTTRSYHLDPVEVRALRASDYSPFAKTTLRAPALERLNTGQDLPYLLQYTPSVVVSSDAGTGVGYTGMRIRGSDLTRINVTLNGVPVNDAESGNTFFTDLPDLASSASSIQIQRGAGTSTNGPGAFGATVSISSLEGMKTPGGEAFATFGSFNTQKYTVKAGTGITASGLSLDMRLSQITSDGYIDRASSTLRAAQLVAGYTPNDRTSLKLMMLAGGEKTYQAWNGVVQDSLATNRRWNELGMMENGTFYDNQTDNYRQNYYQLFADHRFSDRISAHAGLFLTRGIGYYEEYRQGNDLGDYGLPAFVSPSGDTLTETSLIRQLWLDNYNYGAVFSLQYRNEGTVLTFGGNVTRFENNHYGILKWGEFGVPVNHRWYDLDANKNDASAYLKGEHFITKSLMLFGDLQFRNVRYEANGFRKNPGVTINARYSFFNPKAGITYLLRNTAARQDKVYASVAVAQREPVRDDFEASPTQQPKAERMTDFEAGYEMNAGRFSLAANAFYMRYRDQLVLTGKLNDVGAYARTNVDKSYRAGIELQGAAQPAAWVRLGANATFSDNRIGSFTEYLEDYDDFEQNTIAHSNTPIAFSPALIAAASATFLPFSKGRLKPLEAELAGKHVGRQYLDNTGNDDRAIAAYTLADLRIRYTFSMRPFREVMLMVTVANLLDKKYESSGATYPYTYDGTLTNLNYYFPQAGRNGNITLAVKW